MKDKRKTHQNMLSQSINRVVFGVAVAVVLILSILCIIFSEYVSAFLSTIFNYLTIELGFTFICFTIVVIVFFLFIAFSSFGKIRLGDENDRPEYSNTSWLSMIFAAGMGIGLIFWSVAEPLNHFYNPPVSEGASAEAVIESLIDNCLFYSYFFNFHKFNSVAETHCL